MKILRIFTVCFVLMNYSFYTFVSTNSNSKFTMANQDKSKLQVKAISKMNSAKKESKISELNLLSTRSVIQLL